MAGGLDLNRAARVGALGELILQSIEPERGRGEGTLTHGQQALLRAACGDSQIDLYAVSLALIGEAGIEDVWEEEGGLIFVFAPDTSIKPLPREFAQAARQHGIRLNDAERVYREWQALVPDLEERTFIQVCLREVGLPKPAALPMHWKPGPISSEALRRLGVTEQFVSEVLPEFLLVYNESPEVGVSTDQAFFRFANQRWRQYVNAFDESTDYRLLPSGWRPSSQVIRELGKRGFTPEYAERLLPEFRLHASERGNFSRHWGLEFIRFCERGKSILHGQ